HQLVWFRQKLEPKALPRPYWHRLSDVQQPRDRQGQKRARPAARSVGSGPRSRSTLAPPPARSCESGTNRATRATRQWPSFQPVLHRYQSCLFSPISGFVVMRDSLWLPLVEQLFILTRFPYSLSYSGVKGRSCLFALPAIVQYTLSLDRSS